MLFGRRKPGFFQVEHLEEEQQAGQTSNQSVRQPEEDLKGTDEKPELLSYLASLPEAEDPFADTEAARNVQEAEEAQRAQEAEEIPEETKMGRELAEYIRLRSAAAQVTSQKSLKEEVENFDDRLKYMQEDEECRDIVSTVGEKDTYYYSDSNMSNNYAMIAALVEEKDYAMTIAKLVRFNCKTYPVPTPLIYFTRHPYFMTKPQLDRALEQIKREEKFHDVHMFYNSEKREYLYSEDFMSERYAKALAEPSEYTD